MAVSPRPRPTVIPTASAIKVLFDACTGVDEGALERGGGILVDTANVGKDIEGGNVGVGRNDEMVAFERVVIVSESRSNCVGEDDSMNVMVNTDVALPWRLPIPKPPIDD